MLTEIDCVPDLETIEHVGTLQSAHIFITSIWWQNRISGVDIMFFSGFFLLLWLQYARVEFEFLLTLRQERSRHAMRKKKKTTTIPTRW